MGVKIYDCGRLFVVDGSDIAEVVLSKLKRLKKYKPNHLYRGVYASPATLDHIRKHGTDRRLVKRRRTRMSIDPRIDNEDNDPTLTWCGSEEGLEEIIEGYALTSPYKVGDARPTVIVYNADALEEQDVEYLYRFKTNALAAYVAGFTFSKPPKLME